MTNELRDLINRTRVINGVVIIDEPVRPLYTKPMSEEERAGLKELSLKVREFCKNSKVTFITAKAPEIRP